MESLKQTKRLFLLLLVGGLMFSCSKDENIETKANVQQSENFVSLNEASGIAAIIEHPLSSSPKNAALREKSVTSTSKEIEKALAVPDNEGNPALYIVNYKGGGFVMISADNRTTPIKAFSLTGKFPIEQRELPSGLLGWLADTSDMISQIRVINKKQTGEVAEAWNLEEIQKILQLEETNSKQKTSS